MSYYQIEICPLEEECRECKSGKNKMFWGHDEDQVKERVEWHLMKSQYHSKSKADARLLADLSLIEFFEEPTPKRRGVAASAERSPTPKRQRTSESSGSRPIRTPVPPRDPPRFRAIMENAAPRAILEDEGWNDDNAVDLLTGAATAANRCKRIADEASAAFLLGPNHYFFISKMVPTNRLMKWDPNSKQIVPKGGPRR